MKRSLMTKEQVEDLLHFAAYEKRLEAEKKYYGDFSSQGGDAIYE